MKILLITLEYPPQKGGIASYYDGLVNALERQEFSVKVLSSGLLFKWFWPRWLKAYFILRRIIKEEKPDIIFVGQLLPLGTVAWLLRKQAPYLVFCHGMDILSAQKCCGSCAVVQKTQLNYKSFFSWRKRWLAKKILQDAKAIVANSEFTKSQVSGFRFQVLEKTTVVYPCPSDIKTAVAPEQVEALRWRLGLTGKKVLLTLGRVVERKGQDFVIKALPKIVQHYPEIVYLILGEGPYLAKLSQLVSDLHLQPYVRFIGEVANNDKPLYYQLCDIFIMPSRQIGPDVEGFGLSFLEAALFGKPSIGGRSGGIPEAIIDGQTGLLVDPENPAEITRAVVDLLSNEARRQELGQNAKTRASDEFQWEKQIQKLTVFFHK